MTFLSVPWTERLGRDGTVTHLSFSPVFSTFSPHYKEQRDKELRGGRADLLGVWEPESCGLVHGGADPGRHTGSLGRHRVSHEGHLLGMRGLAPDTVTRLRNVWSLERRSNSVTHWNLNLKLLSFREKSRDRCY